MFTYTFRFADGRESVFTVDPKRGFSLEADLGDQAPWTRLERHQCPTCPLLPGQIRHCPPAVDLQPVVQAFAGIAPSGRVEVRVTAPQREYRRECDVQTGLNSLLGLIMATSGCPVLARFRGMARFHLPFSTAEETLFRTVGAYLIRQFFIMRDGGEPDLSLEGLDAQYRQLIEVNTAFAERIREAAPEDASANAIVQFWSISYLVNNSLGEQLEDERAHFQ